MSCSVVEEEEGKELRQAGFHAHSIRLHRAQRLLPKFDKRVFPEECPTVLGILIGSLSYPESACTEARRSRHGRQECMTRWIYTFD